MLLSPTRCCSAYMSLAIPLRPSLPLRPPTSIGVSGHCLVSVGRWGSGASLRLPSRTAVSLSSLPRAWDSAFSPCRCRCQRQPACNMCIRSSPVVTPRSGAPHIVTLLQWVTWSRTRKIKQNFIHLMELSTASSRFDLKKNICVCVCPDRFEETLKLLFGCG